jgi:hypothetical protein
VSVNHLPKMDALGSCDPFCRLEFCGQIHKTVVKKGTYDADYNESFQFEVSDAAGAVGSLTMTVLDWDLGSPPDEIGQIVLPGELMGRVVRSEIGWEGEAKMEVYGKKGEAPVVGRDRQRCTATVKVMVLEGLRGLEPREPDEAVLGPRRLQVSVVSVYHLAKAVRKSPSNSAVWQQMPEVLLMGLRILGALVTLSASLNSWGSSVKQRSRRVFTMPRLMRTSSFKCRMLLQA